MGNPWVRFYYADQHNKFTLELSLGFGNQTAHELKKQFPMAFDVRV